MRTSPPEYSPETGLLRLAELLHKRYSSRICCTEPQCASRIPSACFTKDCGGKQDAEGRHRRLWRCRYSPSCGKKITCTRYIKIAQETLDWKTFTDTVGDVRGERLLQGNEDRDWSEWLRKPTKTPAPSTVEAVRGTKRKIPSPEEQVSVDKEWYINNRDQSPIIPDKTVVRRLFQTPRKAPVTPIRQSERLASRKRVCLELLSDPIFSPTLSPVAQKDEPSTEVNPSIPQDVWAAVRSAYSTLGALLDQGTTPPRPLKSTKTRIPTPFPASRTAATLAIEFGKCQSPGERRSLRDEAKAGGPRFLQLFNRYICGSKQGPKSTK